eukprot:TRINITY_DN5833_c0_g1_i2.p3 TRINITY_DN5833_c0_g1~~TRINITY_DN5833_c0_g1_i2.p3  ORF type:complete len:178 (+),score=13.47 TRINITY_DN5833_c0_g1_i2:116-649(+)
MLPPTCTTLLLCLQRRWGGPGSGSGQQQGGLVITDENVWRAVFGYLLTARDLWVCHQALERSTHITDLVLAAPYTTGLRVMVRATSLAWFRGLYPPYSHTYVVWLQGDVSKMPQREYERGAHQGCPDKFGSWAIEWGVDRVTLRNTEAGVPHELTLACDGYARFVGSEWTAVLPPPA